MQTFFIILMVVVNSIFALPNSPVSSVAITTEQERYLAKQAYGNFACRVNSVIVTTENPGEVDLVTKESIQKAFLNTANLEWAHIAQTSFSSFDGRNEEKVLGTPGGDMGEFIFAIHALAKVSGKVLTKEDVITIFERYLTSMTREKFFYETDERAYIRLAIATGCRNLHIAEIGGLKRKKEELLSKLAVPDHIGDPFIKFLVANATNLDINVEYVSSSLGAFHHVLWSTPSLLSQKLCYSEFKGAHKESALINIKTPAYCVDQGLMPLASPHLACPAPVFINHPDAVKILRRELATIVTLGTTVLPQDVLAAHNTMAENNLEKFMGTITPLIPTYTVTFSNSAPILSSDGSHDDDDYLPHKDDQDLKNIKIN